jgi:hypothetical protein
MSAALLSSKAAGRWAGSLVPTLSAGCITEPAALECGASRTTTHEHFRPEPATVLGGDLQKLLPRADQVIGDRRKTPALSAEQIDVLRRTR